MATSSIAYDVCMTHFALLREFLLVLLVSLLITFVFIGAFIASCIGTLWLSITRDVVQQAESPNGLFVATVEEVNAGATVDFCYDVYIETKHCWPRNKTQVAKLYGAFRRNGAYGVNIKWTAPQKFVVEYYKAQSAKVTRKKLQLAGKTINIDLKSGVVDKNALPLSMNDENVFQKATTPAFRPILSRVCRIVCFE